MTLNEILDQLKMKLDLSQGDLSISSPKDGQHYGDIKSHSSAEIEAMVAQSLIAFNNWKTVPAPVP